MIQEQDPTFFFLPPILFTYSPSSSLHPSPPHISYHWKLDPGLLAVPCWVHVSCTAVGPWSEVIHDARARSCILPLCPPPFTPYPPSFIHLSPPYYLLPLIDLVLVCLPVPCWTHYFAKQLDPEVRLYMIARARPHILPLFFPSHSIFPSPIPFTLSLTIERLGSGLLVEPCWVNVSCRAVTPWSEVVHDAVYSWRVLEECVEFPRICAHILWEEADLLSQTWNNCI